MEVLYNDFMSFLPLVKQEFNKIPDSEVYKCNLKNILDSFNENDNENCIKTKIKLEVISDLLYDYLHTGEWHAISQQTRSLFAISSFLKVLFNLFVDGNKDSTKTLKNCMYIIDMGILLGGQTEFLSYGARKFNEKLNELENGEPSCKKVKLENYDTTYKCDIPVLFQPTLEYFHVNHYIPQKPALLKNVINNWPAMERWHDCNYLKRIAGNRTVPIEIGGQYNTENWSQSLIPFKDFITDFMDESNDGQIYLAQHDLFDQIPELKEDICIPDYITTDPEPRIKAWFGPSRTISPMHTDPTHNLLCQVFGTKEIILAAPEDTNNLYPHEHFVMSNTSQIDPKNLDFVQFPLSKNVKFYHILLQKGDVLYMPPKFWHYVEAKSKSFSVSFWFD